MKTTIHHSTYGFITYEESAWTGKKIITIGGVTLVKIKKNVFQYTPVLGDPFATAPEGEESTPLPSTVTVTVKGNYIGGVSLVIGEETIPLTIKASALDITLGVIPAALFLIFILGGALGGALSAVIGMGLITLLKNRTKTIYKILISLGISVAILAVGIPLLLTLISAQG